MTYAQFIDLYGNQVKAYYQDLKDNNLVKGTEEDFLRVSFDSFIRHYHG